jgi:hypothetical protein
MFQENVAFLNLRITEVTAKCAPYDPWGAKYWQEFPDCQSSVTGFDHPILDTSLPYSDTVTANFLGSDYELHACALFYTSLATYTAAGEVADVEISPTSLDELTQVADLDGGWEIPESIAIPFAILEQVASTALPVLENGVALIGAAMAQVEIGFGIANELNDDLPDPNEVIDENFKTIQQQMGNLESNMLNVLDSRMKKMSTYVDEQIVQSQVQSTMTRMIGMYLTLLGKWGNAVELVSVARNSKYPELSTDWDVLLTSTFNDVTASFASFTFAGTSFENNVLLLSESLFLFGNYMDLVNGITLELAFNKLVENGAPKDVTKLGSTGPIIIQTLKIYKDILTNAIEYATEKMNAVMDAFDTQLFPKPTKVPKLIKADTTCGEVQWMSGTGVQDPTACMVQAAMSNTACTSGFFVFNRGPREYQVSNCGCVTGTTPQCWSSSAQSDQDEVDLYVMPTLTPQQEALKSYVSQFGGGYGVNMGDDYMCTYDPPQWNPPAEDFMIEAGAIWKGRYIVYSLEFKMYIEMAPKIGLWKALLAKTEKALAKLNALYLS